MVESDNLAHKFLQLEKKAIGYENYEDATEESYLKTLDGFKLLVEDIKRESVFSANETMDEIDTEHLKLMMVPYYEANVMFRVMDQRPKRVQDAHKQYLEYLKLMNHYKVLEKLQKQVFKDLLMKNDPKAAAQ